jgi:DnaJ-domain-containing protein 1
VVHVLFFSDRQVRDKLFALVDGTRGLLLVTGLRHGPGMLPPQEREPFDTLEASFGHTLTQVLVADEGTAEGMWRDPLGDLGERLYPRSKQDAYAASNNSFILIESGRPRAIVRKRGTPQENLWFLQEALSQLSPRIPAPDPARKPGPRREAAPKGSRRPRPAAPPASEHTPPRGTYAYAEPPPPAPPPPPVARDPWQVLGISRGTSKDEARKAFRALVTQYHPDKVAHLAPEFQELAERKTRELLEAWEQVEKALS